MFRNNSYVMGTCIGLLLPLLSLGLIYGIQTWLVRMGYIPVLLVFHKQVIISIFVNLIPIRYYFVVLRADRTGRALLAVTFVLALLFFAFRHELEYL
ncbi:MAG: hypothetical protein JW861_02480 [Bacteroidales bacterium]|nr:hypothetical protein [Bacteroidales bacterium]